MDETLETVDRYLERGDLKRAEVLIARLLRANDLSPDVRAEVLLRRTRGRLMAEKPDDALADLQTCFSLRPDLETAPHVLELTGDIFFARFELAAVGFADRADADRALQCYDTLIQHHTGYPNLGWVLYQKGRVLLSQGRVPDAVEAFEQALTAPSRVASLAAFCYERTGFVELFENRNPTSALAYFVQAADAYPPGENVGWLVQLHISRSRALREQGLYSEALAAARQALSIADTSAPDYRRVLAEARLAVGEALAHIVGREEEAIDYLVQFLQSSRRPLGVDVTWSRIHETIGNLAFRLGRYELAVKSYEDALAFNPYHPLEITLYYQMARCYFRLRAYEKAVSTLEQMQEVAAVEGEPILDYRIFNVLGNAYFALEQYAQAAAVYHQALSLAPPGAERLEKLRIYLQLAEELAAQAARQ